MDEERRYWIWLSSVEGMSRRHFDLLLDQYGKPEYVFRQLLLAKRLLPPAAYRHLEAARSEAYVDALFERMERADVRAVTLEDEIYPQRLRAIVDAPATLFVRGELSAACERPLAIVGTRRPSQDGARFAGELARALAEGGVAVVSGLAMGIDERAHAGALEGGGRSVAVLACGPDRCVPEENRALRDRILDQGGAVISEYPPGTGPRSYFFPARNRIISGLSAGVLVAQCGEKSGALITARHARAQGRPLLAVPGPVYSGACGGSNRLLAEGAQAALSAEQVFALFGWQTQRAERSEPAEAAAVEALGEPARALVELLRIDEMSFDELCGRTRMDSARLNALLTLLELRGLVRQSPGRLYRALM